MAFQMSTADDEAMVAFLTTVLDAHKYRRIERDVAVGIIAHAMAAAALDNAGEFKNFIRLPLERHLDD